MVPGVIDFRQLRLERGFRIPVPEDHGGAVEIYQFANQYHQQAYNGRQGHQQA